MPIKRQRNRQWWEPLKRDPGVPADQYDRQVSDADLRQRIRDLDLPDVFRLAELIFLDYVERPRRWRKQLVVWRAKRFGRSGSRPGPKPQLDPADAPVLRAAYADIESMLVGKATPETIASKFDCSRDRIRYQLSTRHGVASKARGVLLVALTGAASPPTPADDDYLRRFLKTGR